MALELDQPDYFSHALSAFQMGRQMGMQNAIRNALDTYGDDPNGAQNALVKLGALPEAAQVGQLHTRQLKAKAMQEAAQKAQTGDFGGAAQAAAANGDPELASQYAQVPDQIWQSHAPMISTMVGVGQVLKKAVPSDPNTPPEVTAAQRQQWLQQHAGELKAYGLSDEQISHPDLDLSDKGIDGFTQMAIAKGAYKPPLMNVPYGNSLINTATGETVIQGSKLHPTTIKLVDGTQVPAFMDPVTRKIYPATVDGQPDMTRGMDDPSAAGQPQQPGAGMQISPNVLRVALAEDSQHPEGPLSVIINRARQTGKTPDEIIAEDGQFEPYGNGAYKKITDAQVGQALMGNPHLLGIMNGQIPDQFKDATYFYAPKAQAALGRGKPSFDDGNGFDVGDTRYFSKPYRGGQSTQAQPQTNQFQPKMDAGDRALVESYKNRMVAGEKITSRNPRDAFLIREAEKEGSAQFGPDFMNPGSQANLKAVGMAMDANAKVTAATESALNHLPYLEDRIIALAKAADQSNIPWINSMKQWAAGHAVSDPRIKPLIDIMGQYRDAYATAAAGQNGSTDSLRSDINHRISSLDSIETLQAVFKENRASAEDRLNQLKGEYDRLKKSISGSGSQSQDQPSAPTQQPGRPATPQVANRAGGLPDATDAQHQAFHNVYKPGAEYGTKDAPLIVRNKQDWDHLGSGQYYIARDGTIGVKP